MSNNWSLGATALDRSDGADISGGLSGTSDTGSNARAHVLSVSRLREMGAGHGSGIADALAEHEQRFFTSNLDFAESDVEPSGFDPFGALDEMASRNRIQFETRAETEDALLTAGLDAAPGRRLADSLDRAANESHAVQMTGDDLVEPDALGLEEYEDAVLARVDSRLIQNVRNRSETPEVADALAESSDLPVTPADEPFNSADVFRELAESNPARDALSAVNTQPTQRVLHGNVLAGLGPEVAADDHAEARITATGDPDRAFAALAQPEGIGLAAGSSPETAGFETPEDEIMFIEDEAGFDEAEDDGVAIDVSLGDFEMSDNDDDMMFAEPIDWSAIDDADSTEFEDDLPPHVETDMSDDPFAGAAPSQPPESDFAELGFHHNFIIGDFSADGELEAESIELEFTGLDLDGLDDE